MILFVSSFVLHLLPLVFAEILWNINIYRETLDLGSSRYLCGWTEGSFLYFIFIFNFATYKMSLIEITMMMNCLLVKWLIVKIEYEIEKITFWIFGCIRRIEYIPSLVDVSSKPFHLVSRNIRHLQVPCPPVRKKEIVHVKIFG